MKILAKFRPQFKLLNQVYFLGEKPFQCGVCNKKFIQGTALKTHQKQFGHLTDNPKNPDQQTSISVNNPRRIDNRIGGKRWEPIDEKLIRTVKMKRTRVSKQPKFSEKLVSEIKVETPESNELNILPDSIKNMLDEPTFEQISQVNPSASYGVTLLSNGTVLMAEMPPNTTLFHITPQ